MENILVCVTGQLQNPLRIVEFEHLARFGYLSDATGYLPADLYENGVINYDDLLEFANAWLCVCPYNWPLK